MAEFEGEVERMKVVIKQRDKEIIDLKQVRKIFSDIQCHTK